MDDCRSTAKYPKILIAEDERITAQHLRQCLSSMGYDVVAVTSSGPATIREAGKRLPDLLLTDIRLRGSVDGIDAAAEIRERWSIPTVFLTAYADPDTMRRARIVEPYGYLIKPFAEDELHATIEIALQQRELLAVRQQQTRTNLSTIERTQEELDKLTGRLVAAQEEERHRIARDIHDDFTQRLVVAVMNLQSLEESLSSETAKLQCQKILANLDALSEDLRKLSHNLHPSTLEHLGLVPALRALAEDFEQRESIPICVSTRNVPSNLPEDAKIAIYRIVQEALRNVVKHASAQSIDVALVGGQRELHVSVRDVGRGFDAGGAQTQPGLGLVSMTQRAHLIGGALDIKSELGVGTQVMLRLPLSAERQG